MPNFQTIQIPYPEPCNCPTKADIEFYVANGKWPEPHHTTLAEMAKVMKEIYTKHEE